MNGNATLAHELTIFEKSFTVMSLLGLLAHVTEAGASER